MNTLPSCFNHGWRPRVVAGLIVLSGVLLASPSYASPLAQRTPEVTPVTVAAVANPNPAFVEGVQLVAKGEWAAALTAFTAAQQQLEQAADHRGEAESWLQIGAVQLHLEEYTAAEKAYTAVSTLAKAANDPTLTGMALDGLGALYTARHELSKALDAYQRALRLWYDTGASDKATHTLMQVSDLYSAQEAFEEAQKATSEAVAIAEKLNDPLLQQALLQQSVKLHQTMALHSYCEELAIWQALADQTQEGATLHNIGLLLQEMGQYDEALTTFHDEILRWRALDQRAQEAEAHYSIAIIHILRAQTTPALAALDLALVTAQAGTAQRLEGKILSKQGDLYQLTGDYAAARTAYQGAAAVWQSLADLGEEGNALSNIGKIYALQGQFSEAIKVLTTAHSYAKSAADTELEAKVLEKLGEVYGAQGTFPKAITAFQDALTLWRATADAERTTGVLLSLGGLYLDAGQAEKAEAHLQEALHEAEGANDQRLSAGVFDKLGDLYLTAAKPQQALTAYQAALTRWQAIADPLRSVNTLLNISGIQLALTQPNAALTTINEAWQVIQNTPDAINAEQAADAALLTARILNRRGDVYVGLADPAQALTAYQEALTQWRALNDADGLSGALVALGSVLVAQGESKAGLANFNEALALARTRNNATLLAKTLNSLGDAYLKLGNYEEALRTQQEALTGWRTAGNLLEQGKTLRKIGKLNTLLGQQLLVGRTESGLVEPAEGATVRGVVTIKGVANHVTFQKWQLDLLLNEDEQQATSIGISAKPKPKVGAFLNWDTTQYPNGTHKLRLRVVHEGANYDEYLMTVIIDN